MKERDHGRNGEKEMSSVQAVEKTPEKEAGDDAFFPVFGSMLVYGAGPLLENLMTEYKQELVKYNRKLGRLKIPLRVRLTHAVVVKGNRYVYCGRYLFRKTRRGEKYVGKMDNALLRNEMREKWDKAGPPPENKLDGFRFRVVEAKGVVTGDVIVPYLLYHDQKFNHLFKGLTAFRLAGT